MLGVRPSGYTEAWPLQGPLLGRLAHFALQPLGWLWLRPRPVRNCANIKFTIADVGGRASEPDMLVLLGLLFRHIGAVTLRFRHVGGRASEPDMKVLSGSDSDM